MSAAEKPSALVQRTLHMLILKTLSLESMHGAPGNKNRSAHGITL